MNCQPSSFCVIDRPQSDWSGQGKPLNVHNVIKNQTEYQDIAQYRCPPGSIGGSADSD